MDFDAGGAAALLGGDDGAGAAGGAGGADGGDPNAQGGADGSAGGGGDAGAGGDDGGSGGDAAPDWLGRLSADTSEGDTASNRDWVQAKQFKDLDGLVKAYRDTEKALRDSGRVKMPGEGAPAEEVAAWRTAIGVPEAPEGYEVKLPETNGGLELNTDLIGKLTKAAHEIGTPKAAFEALAGVFVQEQVNEHLASVKAQTDEANAKLAEWGAQKDAKLADCQAAMRALGVDRAELAAWQGAVGSAKVLERLAKIGGGIAEDTLITGGTGRFGVSAAEAQGEIDKIKADPALSAKVAVKGSPEAARWDRLLGVVAAAKARETGN